MRKAIRMSILNEFPPVAQLDRVSDYESEGHVFESRRAGQLKTKRHEIRAFFLCFACQVSFRVYNSIAFGI